MSDIKQIKFDVPINAPKTRKARKTTKTELKTTQVKPTPKVIAPTTGGTVIVEPVKVANQKKPVINVNLPYANSPHTPSPKTPKSTNVVSTPPVRVIQKPSLITRKAPLKVNIQKNKRKNFTMKRKFIARKITINIENANKIKKNREAVEKKVANMTMAEITKNLRANGLVRKDANPPEKMQKAMMIDLLLFPVPL